jgi:hypothetical protein
MLQRYTFKLTLESIIHGMYLLRVAELNFFIRVADHLDSRRELARPRV